MKKKLDSCLEDSSPSNTMVKHRVMEFIMGQISATDEQHVRRPTDVTKLEKMEKSIKPFW